MPEDARAGSDVRLESSAGYSELSHKGSRASTSGVTGTVCSLGFLEYRIAVLGVGVELIRRKHRARTRARGTALANNRSAAYGEICDGLSVVRLELAVSDVHVNAGVDPEYSAAVEITANHSAEAGAAAPSITRAITTHSNRGNRVTIRPPFGCSRLLHGENLSRRLGAKKSDHHHRFAVEALGFRLIVEPF